MSAADDARAGARPAPAGPAGNGAPALEARGVVKDYRAGGQELHVLRGVDLVLMPGEWVSLVGASGTGKSTLLRILGTLEEPTAGEVRLEGLATTGQSEPALARLRRQRVGFVFQFHNLLGEFTALENVMMPALIRRTARNEARRAAQEMLAMVGLSERVAHKPGELSGGEQQRVALARALCLKPRLLLADEPTGNLDPATADGIHRLLQDLNQRLGITMVIVTHNERLADALPRRLRLVAGRLAG